jgi:hypothetical protein
MLSLGVDQDLVNQTLAIAETARDDVLGRSKSDYTLIYGVGAGFAVFTAIDALYYYRLNKS